MISPFEKIAPHKDLNKQAIVRINRVLKSSIIILLAIILLSTLSACSGLTGNNSERLIYSDTKPQSQSPNRPFDINAAANTQKRPLEGGQDMLVGQNSYGYDTNRTISSEQLNNAQYTQNGAVWVNNNQASNTASPYGQNAAYNNNQQGYSNIQASTVVANKTKIAILLPLSGTHANLGQSMLQAAQLALFDMNYNQLELVPHDTKGTSSGARTAAQKAVNDGASIILGPVFSHSVKAAKPISKSSNIPLIGFSTDWRVAGDNSFIMGVLPFAQADRLAKYAAKRNWRRIGIIAPSDAYGNAVVQTFKARASALGIKIVKETRFAAGSNNITPQVREFAQYDSRVQRLDQEKKALKASGDAEALAKLNSKTTFGDTPYDAILAPVGGAQAKSLLQLLANYDLGPNKVAVLGTGLWDDKNFHNKAVAQKAYYAAPAPSLRRNFEQKYESVYGSTPPRLVSIAYDATALTVVLARQSHSRNGQALFTPQALLNPNGFAGIDGIFRFKRNGRVERGLAIHQITNYSSRVVDQAPTSFQKSQY